MDVAININDITYPEACPFHPDRSFPELNGLYECPLDADNKVYGAVRDLLVALELDREHIGKACWNPFSDFIKQGDRVVIKPNLVLHHSGRKKDITAVVTHASLIRPLIDYTLLALKRAGGVRLSSVMRLREMPTLTSSRRPTDCTNSLRGIRRRVMTSSSATFGRWSIPTVSRVPFGWSARETPTVMWPSTWVNTAI